MTTKLIASLAGVGMMLGVSSLASAAPVNPVFDTFGAQPTFTFGGSGIPNNAVATSVYVVPIIRTDGNGQEFNADLRFTLGLTATPRTDATLNPVTNDGAGTFNALPGADGSSTRSRWNIGFYAALSSVVIPNGTTFSTRLYYDLDPGVATDLSAHGILTSDTNGAPTPNQGSQNMTFNFWRDLPTDIPGIVAPTGYGPSGAAFDFNAPGEYTFKYVLVNGEGDDIEASAVAIRVNVGATQVPLPGTLALLGLGMGAIALSKRRRQV